MNVPAERIHLHMVGQPQETSEAVALLLACTLQFCAQPGEFARFVEFTRRDNAAHDWVIKVMASLEPGVLLGLEALLAAGMMADYEAEL